MHIKDSQVGIKSYRTLVTCPWWGRPNIVELHCKSMERFIKNHADYLAILSPEDPYLKRLEKLVYLYGFKKTYFKNIPLGHKMNHGFKQAEGYDYIMNMGSDDLCDPRYWRDIQPYMGKPLFKVNRIYGAEDISLKKIWEIKGINMGVLRMIRTDIITKDLYPATNKSLDKGSRNTLASLGYREETVASGLTYVIDVKGENSITPIRRLLKKNGKRASVDLKRFI